MQIISLECLVIEKFKKKSLDNKLIKDVDQNLSKNDDKHTENFSQDKNEINNKITTKVV